MPAALGWLYPSIGPETALAARQKDLIRLKTVILFLIVNDSPLVPNSGSTRARAHGCGAGNAISAGTSRRPLDLRHQRHRQAERFRILCLGWHPHRAIRMASGKELLGCPAARRFRFPWRPVALPYEPLYLRPSLLRVGLHPGRPTHFLGAHWCSPAQWVRSTAATHTPTSRSDQRA